MYSKFSNVSLFLIRNEAILISDHIFRSYHKNSTCLRALAKDSMATASLPGVATAKSATALAISISDAPCNIEMNNYRSDIVHSL